MIRLRGAYKAPLIFIRENMQMKKLGKEIIVRLTVTMVIYSVQKIEKWVITHRV